MADDPGLLDTAWEGWKNFWTPTSAPAGAAYDPETLGIARSQAIGALGGRLLALSQGGLQPAQRAAILGSIGEVPQIYQQGLSAGVDMRLHGAAAKKTEQELAAEEASNKLFDEAIRQKTSGGSGTTAAPPSNLPTGGAIQTALAALAPSESGGRAGAVNSQGYSGRYQIGSALASSAGIYKPAPGEATADERGRATNQWGGQWVLPGFQPMSHQEFLANPQAQEVAGQQAMAHNWQAIQAAGLDKYIGQNVGGVTVTAPGLLQGAWLGGVGGLKTWLSGQGDPADSNRTTVSKWASLQPPGGATMTDASGSTYPGDPTAGAPGGGPPGAGTGRPRSLSDLSIPQLQLLRGLPVAERNRILLEQSLKPANPVVLKPEEAAGLGLPPGAYTWSPTEGPKRIGDLPTSEVSVAEKARLGLGPDAIVQRKGDGSLQIVREGNTSWMTPAQLAEHGFNPDAKVTVGSDGKPSVIDKGTDADAPLTIDGARGVLTKYSQAVEQGKLDPNSLEGRRYRAAHDLLSQQGQWVEVKQPDGSVTRVFQPVPVSAPRLGPAPPGMPSIQTAPPASQTARTPQQLFSDATQARREIESGPVYNNYSNARPMLLSIRQAEPVGTGASDRQMIYAYAKMLDPTSVVMTSEGQAVQRTGGVWDSIQGMLQQVKGDGTLSPAVRRNLVEQAESIFATHETAYKDRVDTYRNLAQRGGLNPDDVYPPVQTVSRYTPPGAPMRLPDGQTEDSFVNGLKASVKAKTGTAEEAKQILRRYGIDPKRMDQ